MTNTTPKRVVIISDLHCGHAVGLTPPENEEQAITPHDKKLLENRRNLWNFYEQEMKALGTIDLLIVNGDMIDGKGERSGGTEQITTDRQKQCVMAATCIEVAKAKKIVMTYGTDSHTGKDEDWEGIVAFMAGAEKIGSHEWVDVNGLIFDCKHHMGSSGIAHGRHTAVAKERSWNVLWSEYEEAPKSDVIIRSHVHYFNYCGGHGWLAMSTPALQGMGSKYGARRCSGTVDFGFVVFDVKSKGEYSWSPKILKLKQHSSTIKV